jgi:hypothetical protein
MKHIKRFNESFEHIPYVIKTVEELLYQIEDFEFKTKVDFNSSNTFNKNLLTIDIEKDSKEFKVFNSIDIKEAIIEIDNYLTLGEDFKLKEVFVRNINPSKADVITFKELLGGINLLYCELVYEIKK